MPAQLVSEFPLTRFAPGTNGTQQQIPIRQF